MGKSLVFCIFNSRCKSLYGLAYEVGHIFEFVVNVGHVFRLDSLDFSSELCSPYYGETESEELLKVTWKNSTMSPELQRQWWQQNFHEDSAPVRPCWVCYRAVKVKFAMPYEECRRDANSPFLIGRQPAGG